MWLILPCWTAQIESISIIAESSLESICATISPIGQSVWEREKRWRQRKSEQKWVDGMEFFGWLVCSFLEPNWHVDLTSPTGTELVPLALGAGVFLAAGPPGESRFVSGDSGDGYQPQPPPCQHPRWTASPKMSLSQHEVRALKALPPTSGQSRPGPGGWVEH